MDETTVSWTDGGTTSPWGYETTWPVSEYETTTPETTTPPRAEPLCEWLVRIEVVLEHQGELVHPPDGPDPDENDWSGRLAKGWLYTIYKTCGISGEHCRNEYEVATGGYIATKRSTTALKKGSDTGIPPGTSTIKLMPQKMSSYDVMAHSIKDMTYQDIKRTELFVHPMLRPQFATSGCIAIEKPAKFTAFSQELQAATKRPEECEGCDNWPENRKTIPIKIVYKGKGGNPKYTRK